MKVDLAITIITFTLTTVICTTAETTADDFHYPTGHLKPFGSSGPFAPVEEFHGFPGTAQFFERFVMPSRPLKMVGAGQVSRAFEMWSDEYFLSRTMNDDSSVTVETDKKENRTNPVLHMHFHDFVRTYNSQNSYLVNRVPDEFRSDVVLPGPLQCPFIYDNMLVEMIMWMSSGGTSSVVHTDSVDNILCLYAGQKTFVMVDPEKYFDKVTFDHPEGSYSGIDVDRVDFVKYPGLADVEYHLIDLQSGDCIYIPYKWIHQVRSTGRNLAVNFWWNHHMNRLLNLDQCSNNFDPELTIDKVKIHGFESFNDDLESFRDYLFNLLQDGVDVNEFIRRYISKNEEVLALDPGSGYRLPLIQIFIIMDQNRDKSVSTEEMDSLSQRDWDMILKQVDRFESLVGDALEKRSKATRKPYFKNEL